MKGFQREVLAKTSDLYQVPKLSNTITTTADTTTITTTTTTTTIVGVDKHKINEETVHFIGKLSMPLRHHRQTCKIYKGIKEVAIQIKMTLKNILLKIKILKTISKLFLILIFYLPIGKMFLSWLFRWCEKCGD